MKYLLDSQYVHSDVDEIEEELMGSEDDDDEQSSDDFRKRVDFGNLNAHIFQKIRSSFVCSLSKLGIDPLLSARIEREEKEAIITPAIAAPRSINSTENTGLLSIKILRNLNRI